MDEPAGRRDGPQHPVEADAALWLSARSIADLSELGAQWLEGLIRWQPCYCADRPDPETDELTPVLASINRSGLWTINSQPGEVDDEWAQRATVSGYCTEATCNAILAATIDSDLIVLALPAVLDSVVQIPVSRWGNVENTWAGANSDPASCYAGQLPEAAVDAIRGAWYVEVTDPVWGRNDLLWDVVLTGLREHPERLMTNHGQFGDIRHSCQTAV